MPDIPVVVLGAGGVGKSCLTIQYIQGHFVNKYDATIEDVYRKPVDIDNQPAVLTIVDTAGQDAFGAMRDQYLRKGQGFVFVYSITDAESFQQLKRIYAQLRRVKAGQSVSCVVVGNKIDEVNYRAVSTEEGRLFAAQAQCPFLEVTAKNRKMAEDVFETLVRTIRGKQHCANNGGGGGGAVVGVECASAASLRVSENTAFPPLQDGVTDRHAGEFATLQQKTETKKRKKKRRCVLL